MLRTSSVADGERPGDGPVALRGRLGVDIDLVLIGLTMLVTVPRVGWWMARWEQPDLWFVGYAAAVVFDLASLRLAYVWRRTGNRRSRLVTGIGFAFSAACSGIFQAFYLLSQSASLAEAASLAAIWPVALGILALHKAGQDEGQDRRAARCGTRSSRVRDVPAGRSNTVHEEPTLGHQPGRRRAWTSEQRREALRLAGSGLSVRKVAEQIGVPRSTVGAWLRSAQPLMARTQVSGVESGAGPQARPSGGSTMPAGDETPSR